MNWFNGILKLYNGTPGIYDKPFQEWACSFTEAQKIVDKNKHIQAAVWMYHPAALQMEPNE